MNDISSKKILDPCSGSRMFYFDKNNPDVLFCDNRILHDEKIWKSTKNDSVRHVDIEPDVQCDVRNLPFPDNSFVHVIFDPPHLLKVGENAWICKKYGKLPEDWRQFIRDGFSECWRVLKKDGTLIFKWNETDIPVRDILKVLPVRPVYGHRSGKASKTHWMAFVKTNNLSKVTEVEEV